MRQITIAVILLCLAGTPALTAEQWTLTERTVPTPVAASAELQQLIGNGPQPTLAAAPTTAAQWHRAAESADALRAQIAEAGVATFPGTVLAERIAGVPVHRLTPESGVMQHSKRIFMELHGGAYVYGSGIAGIREALLIAERVGITTIAVDYRMPALDMPFPAALDDALRVYLALLEEHESQSIAIGGTSAGAGLALALVHRLKAIEAPLPAAIYAGTPWADLTKTGDTLYTNQGIDRILVAYEGLLQGAAALYVGTNDPRDPLLSPVYGDFNGFPATLLASGTRDMFLSDVARTHRLMRAAGVTADLHVYEGLSHAGYMVAPDIPESVDLYAELGQFLHTHLK